MEIRVNDKRVIIEGGVEKDYIDLHNASTHPTGEICYSDPYFESLWRKENEK